MGNPLFRTNWGPPWGGAFKEKKEQKDGLSKNTLEKGGVAKNVRPYLPKVHTYTPRPVADQDTSVS